MFLLKYMYLLAQGSASQSLYCWTFCSQGVSHDHWPAWLQPHRNSTEKCFCRHRKPPASVLSNRTDADRYCAVNYLLERQKKNPEWNQPVNLWEWLKREWCGWEGWQESKCVNTTLDLQVGLHPKAFPLIQDKHNNTLLGFLAKK